MELALNLIWLAIAIGSFVELTRWSLRQPAGRRSRVRIGIAASAVVCLVALLFPIISISDDLSSNAVFVETSIKRRAPREDREHGGTPTSPSAAILSAPPQNFDLTLAGATSSHPLLIAAAIVLSCLGARAPPLAVC